MIRIDLRLRVNGGMKENHGFRIKKLIESTRLHIMVAETMVRINGFFQITVRTNGEKHHGDSESFWV